VSDVTPDIEAMDPEALARHTQELEAQLEELESQLERCAQLLRRASAPIERRTSRWGFRDSSGRELTTDELVDEYLRAHFHGD